MLHQLFASGLKARDIYEELWKHFYKENAEVTWEDFLTTKFGLWIGTRSSTDIILHGSSREWKKVAYYFKLKKQLKLAMLILHATCLASKKQWLI